MTTTELLQRLECGRGGCPCHGTARRGRGLTHCPAHDDVTPSLNISEEAGKALWRCHAGCSQDAVTAAIAELDGRQPTYTPGAPGQRTRGRKVALYDYVDEENRLVYQVVRWEPKRFTQRRPLDDGTWSDRVKGVRRVLYRLPELLAARPARRVLLVEGEKDVDQLRALGFLAVTYAGGVNAPWEPAWTALFTGRKVAIIPDADRPGLAKAKAIARQLVDVAEEVKVVELSDLQFRADHGDDVSDWIRAGHGEQDLKDLVAAAPVFDPEEPPDPRLQPDPGAPPVGEDAPPAPPRPAPNGAFSLVQVRRASTIKPRRINFLWRGRIARGKLTAIGGDPGAGKGTLGINFAAHITRGLAWPDGEPCARGRAMLLTPEDDAADTIVPRLIAADADLDQVDLEPQITGDDGKPRRINLETDAAQLMAFAGQAGVVVVVIDPISSYLGASTNSWRDADMRRILDPLAEAAAVHGIAIILVAHLTKDSNRRAMYRFQGSIASVAAARFAFVVAGAPKDPERRVIACIKTNLGAMPAALTFRIVSERVEEIDEEVGRIEWTGATAMTADELLGPKQTGAAQDRAEEFLLEYLANGQAWSTAVQASAKAKGIGRDSLWAAKAELGVIALKVGLDGWMWKLPAGSGNQDGSDRGDTEAGGGGEVPGSAQDGSGRFSSKQATFSVITGEDPPLPPYPGEPFEPSEASGYPPAHAAVPAREHGQR